MLSHLKLSPKPQLSQNIQLSVYNNQRRILDLINSTVSVVILISSSGFISTFDPSTTTSALSFLLRRRLQRHSRPGLWHRLPVKYLLTRPRISVAVSMNPCSHTNFHIQQQQRVV
ncbi:hypothetical protein CFOL_v3_11118 [Cephalotus follicularis]|uniref:Uncharacterized protein n=1 Tax=Cephalotus follicularis TaxID=3775 RepID=A0A1Q3BIL7_CEPFO|nr:hypothetical protein CFOL_v3_11118 [Cephalotus follicularis]